MEPPSSSGDKNAMLSKAVYEWIEENIGRSQSMDGVTQKHIDFGQVHTIFELDHAMMVKTEYPALDLGIHIPYLMIAMTEKLNERPPQPQLPSTSASNSDVQVSTIEQSFETDFLGNADEEFKACLLECWDAYKTNVVLKYPFTTIVQSSGFGKSRLLYELASKMQKNEPMRVLYTCMRQNGTSAGFPNATSKVNDFFFPSDCTVESITQSLYVTFEYAMKNWETVGIEWLGLFSRLSRKRIEFNSQFSKAQENLSSSTDEIQAAIVLPSTDNDISSRLNKFAKTVSLNKSKTKLNVTRKPLHDAKRQPFNSISIGDPSKHILIFAVDKARALLNDQHTDAASKTSKHRLLRHALKKVNEKIQNTHIFDIFFNAVKNSRLTVDFSRDMVLKGLCDTNQAWRDFVFMGRPLRRSVVPLINQVHLTFGQMNQEDLLIFAASKLTCDISIMNRDAMSEKTMYGVASVLCRVGLRPNSSSSLASRAVTDFMAMLGYVSYTQDQYFSDYFSDPILTFGAAQLWYIHETIFADRILPQLNKLLTQEALDAGAVEVIVARILLLLAMDAHADASASSIPNLAQFHSVSGFMKTLRDPNVQLPLVEGKREANLIHEHDAKSKDWRIGFSHFIQMADKPTEGCLWYLLSRRAAGVFPRNQTRADLFIPIFCPGDGSSAPRVSMIIFQVIGYNIELSQLSKEVAPMYPSHLSDSTNELSKKKPNDVLRVIWSLGGAKPKRSYFMTSEKPDNYESSNTNATPTLFMHGIEAGYFVSETVANQLNLLLTPMWSTMNLVKKDLELCDRAKKKSLHEISDAKLVKIARKPMSDLLGMIRRLMSVKEAEGGTGSWCEESLIAFDWDVCFQLSGGRR